MRWGWDSKVTPRGKRPWSCAIVSSVPNAIHVFDFRSHSSGNPALRCTLSLSNGGSIVAGNSFAALELADRKLAARVKLAVARLTAESRKVGGRVIIAAQRFEAASVGGAVVRSNCPIRVSFRVENATSIGFLHDDPDPQIVSEHVRAPAGVALLSAPGQPLRRLRFPNVTFAQWAEAAA